MKATELVGEGDLHVSLDETDQTAAVELFDAAGVVVMEGILPKPLIEQCSQEWDGMSERIDQQLHASGIELEGRFSFAEVSSRGQGRYDTRHLGGVFADAELLNGSAPWWPFVRAIMGQGAVELWKGVVNNRRASGVQNWHRDGEALFDHVQLPPHCVTVFVPLVDVTEANGPTEFYPGSHERKREHYYAGTEEGACHLPTCAPCLVCGSALLFDYRLVHRGTANTTDTDRPMLYFVYAQPWFQDVQNFPSAENLFPP